MSIFLDYVTVNVQLRFQFFTYSKKFLIFKHEFKKRNNIDIKTKKRGKEREKKEEKERRKGKRLYQIRNCE